MDDVQDADAGSEPSMEEILASIRRIIADEKAPSSDETADAINGVADGDTLELTQMIQDDGSILDVTAQAPEPAPQPAAFAPEPEPMPEFKAPERVAPEPVIADNLISDTVANVAASSLAALANTVQVERAASSPVSYTPLGRGERTLESMVLELMRPMLRAWLDENLPPIVDRLVQKEVERIARKASE